MLAKFKGLIMNFYYCIFSGLYFLTLNFVDFWYMFNAGVNFFIFELRNSSRSGRPVPIATDAREEKFNRTHQIN